MPVIEAREGASTVLDLGLKHQVYYSVFGSPSWLPALLESRFELGPSSSVYSIDSDLAIVLAQLTSELLPKPSELSSIPLLNMLLLDLAYTQRAWRLASGLPSHGQRTWSNASTSRRCARDLHRHKVSAASVYFSGVDSSELSLAVRVEQVSMLWYQQWRSEWSYSRSALRRAIGSKRVSFNFDMRATALGLLGSLRRDNSKVGKKKKKAVNRLCWL